MNRKKSKYKKGGITQPIPKVDTPLNMYPDFLQEGGSVTNYKSLDPIKATIQQIVNKPISSVQGVNPEEQRSRLKKFFKIQTGVDNYEKGPGYYLYYKDPNSKDYNEVVDREYTTRDAFRNQVLPSQQYREYLTKTGGLNRATMQTGGYYENNNQNVDFFREQIQPISSINSVGSTLPSFQNQLSTSSEESIKPLQNTYIPENNILTNNNSSSNFMYFNPYGGFDIPSAAYKLGQGIETGNAFDLTTSGLKLATGLGRNIAAGIGNANRRENVMQDYYEKTRAASMPVTQVMQEGGETQQPSPEQIVQSYAEMTQQDVQAIIQQLQQLSSEEQSQALQQMLMALQQGQQPQMQNGGYLVGADNASKKKDLAGFRNEDHLQKVMTGEYVSEQMNNKPAVAELETDEYIKKPNGEVVKVIGETHEKGGVLLTEDQLPEGSKVISDHLEVGKEGAKRFNKEYALGVKPKDTYAQVLDRFNKKIGLTKIVEEQEEITKELNKQAEKLLDNPEKSDTLTLNINFKTAKFEELEEQKKPLKELQKNLFEEVFRPQEEFKMEENSNEFMQNGGNYNGDVIVNLSNKYNLPKDRVLSLLQEFQLGGVTSKYSVKSGKNPYSVNQREKQSANETAYGVVDNQTALQRLYDNFPDIVNSDSGFKNYINVDKSGNIEFKKNIPLNTQSELVNNVQRLTDKRMKDSAQTILNNPENFDPETIKEAQRYYNEETFIPDAENLYQDDKTKAIRGYDSKLGNFTSGRYALEMDLVTPEEKQLLNSNGIKTLRQLKESPLKAKLSPNTLQRVNRVEQLVGDSNSDYGINEVIPQTNISQTSEDNRLNYKSYDGNNSSEANTTLGLLNLPDQSPLLPDSLQPALKIERRYDRVEAPLASPDAQVAEIRRQEQAAMQGLNSLPDAQRASAVAQIQANTQANINNVMSQVQNQNLANTFQANNANSQIQAREEDARANDLLNYEARILRADAITDQDIKNYFKTSQKVNLNNYNTVNATNLVNSMYNNSRYDGNGIRQTNLEAAPDYSSARPMTDDQIIKAAQAINQKNKLTARSKKRFSK